MSAIISILQWLADNWESIGTILAILLALLNKKSIRKMKMPKSF